MTSIRELRGRSDVLCYLSDSEASAMSDFAERLLASRSQVYSGPEPPILSERAEEGGCGVTGFACTVPVGGRFIYEPSDPDAEPRQRQGGRHRGGRPGARAAGHLPTRCSTAITCSRSHCSIPPATPNWSGSSSCPNFDIALSTRQAHIDDYRDIPGLEVRPPDVHRYVVRVKPGVLKTFAETAGLEGLAPRELEDEFVWRNSYRLNDAFYASLGEKRAFVLSHGRNLLVFKLVGYAEQNVEYYQLQDFKAHVWIAHQRYPTKGRVWHPGGAHPFVGLNEALVHNGDFANYHSVCEYLRQRNIRQQFLTDTEVSVQLFDLWDRVYKYPLEYIIEALAPTTELDFDQLPPEKQVIYRQIQATHIHASPDGPWFFIIARSQREGIPVARHHGYRDAPPAGLRPLRQRRGPDRPDLLGKAGHRRHAAEPGQGGPAILPRGGQVLERSRRLEHRRRRVHFHRGAGWERPQATLLHRQVRPGGQARRRHGSLRPGERLLRNRSLTLAARKPSGRREGVFRDAQDLPSWPAGQLRRFCEAVLQGADNTKSRAAAIELLTRLHDRRFNIGDKRRATVIQVIEETLEQLFDSAPLFGEPATRFWRRVTWATRHRLAAPQPGEELLCIDAQGFPPEGDECDAVLLRTAYQAGWKRFIVYRLRGQRFQGVGLGPATDGVRIDLYGSNGDYAASGMDGLEIHIHGNAQDQVAQIAKRGKLVIYGDVGQTFMYGAKGGEVYVLGNAAGRPLINAVGRPRVVINGTCLDFLAESFMAGDPLAGGGFVILNGIEFDGRGRMVPQPAPYPGSNLFSLASGGAIYIRDPQHKVIERQLNGGVFSPLDDKDWRLIRPYLEENERLFGIRVEDLLSVDGEVKAPREVYRKVSAVKLSVLAGSEKKK